MHFTIQRESLLKPLQLVAGVVERRQTLPVLSNVLIVINGQHLSLTGTDLEVELVAHVSLADPSSSGGEITVPAKKLMDICKSLPAESFIDIKLDDNKLILKSGRSRFTLSTLPATDFPNVEEIQEPLNLYLPQGLLRRLIEQTSFAMAQQDVRYYLNGMLLEVQSNRLRAVTTDGHRLALCSLTTEIKDSLSAHQVIVPRKGILELVRLLNDQTSEVNITLGQHHVRATVGDFTFTSKLVDGKFPDYERVVPRGGDKLVIANRQALREALSRAAILSNEKYRGVRLLLDSNLLKVQANNPDQEEAEEELVVEYSGSTLEISFNVGYLLDVLAVMSTEKVRLIFSDANSSALIQELENDDSSYVIMPMRL